MVEVIKTTFQLRRGYEAVWEKNNPILATGEPGFVIDKNLLKIGDGTTRWNDLEYLNAIDSSGIIKSFDTKEQFPVVGDINVIYRARNEKKLYQWNSDLKAYELLNETETIVLEDLNYKKIEIIGKPQGTLVSEKESEIRIMCPKNTNWEFQESGSSADKNKFYIGFKIYAPSKEIYSFKEDLSLTIQDQTMYYFENNDFAGIEENGRKFSIVWLPVAHYNEDEEKWQYYGENSTIKKYVGWYYSVEWYDTNGINIATDTIRINLSNEETHNNIEPYYMGAINANKLYQDEGDFLILYGGSATDNI